MDNKEYLMLERIKERMAQIPGYTGLYYYNLSTGYEYGVRTDEVFSAASVIKLPLYLHILDQCASKRIMMSDRVTVTQDDKVPICGALTLFTGPVETDIATLCRLMISISDNTATNRLIDHCGLDAIQEGFVRMGLVKTQLCRKLFDQEASARGFAMLFLLLK